MTLLILFGPHIKCVFVRFITWADLIKAAKKEKKTPNSFRVRVSISRDKHVLHSMSVCNLVNLTESRNLFILTFKFKNVYY